MSVPTSDGNTSRYAVTEKPLDLSAFKVDISGGDRFLLRFGQSPNECMDNDAHPVPTLLAYRYRLAKSGLHVSFWENTKFDVHREMIGADALRYWWIILEIFNQEGEGRPYFMKSFNRPELVGIRGDASYKGCRSLSTDLFFPNYKV